MYRDAPTLREGYQRTILRKYEEVLSWAGKNLDSTEEYGLTLTHDGLGLKVFVRSLRATVLLGRLHKDVFGAFSQPNLSVDERRVWSAWFGYSEPFPTPTCHVL
jgi:hypothetical protein